MYRLYGPFFGCNEEFCFCCFSFYNRRGEGGVSERDKTTVPNMETLRARRLGVPGGGPEVGPDQLPGLGQERPGPRPSCRGRGQGRSLLGRQGPHNFGYQYDSNVHI